MVSLEQIAGNKYIDSTPEDALTSQTNLMLKPSASPMVLIMYHLVPTSESFEGSGIFSFLGYE
jgi:hypothetical protein